MTERDEAFEELKSGHGLLRELPGLRVWGVDDGALVLGEDATQFVFCSQGALVVRQTGAWPHVLTAGMYASVPGKCEVRPVGQDLSQGLVISRHGWLGTAGRYARTDLYGTGLKEPPPGMSWQEMKALEN